MIVVTYPLNLPEPTSVSHSRPSELMRATKMQSGRRRVRNVMPGVLSSGTLKWTFLPEEYRIFQGWWTHILRNGSYEILFDEDSAMVKDVGFRLIMLRTNTLSAPTTVDSKVEVQCEFYALQEA